MCLRVYMNPRLTVAGHHRHHATFGCCTNIFSLRSCGLVTCTLIVSITCQHARLCYMIDWLVFNHGVKQVQHATGYTNQMQCSVAIRGNTCTSLLATPCMQQLRIVWQAATQAHQLSFACRNWPWLKQKLHGELA